MIHFAYPSQRLQDWFSQQWCIWRGQKMDLEQESWLIGPFGNTDSIADNFIEKLALDEGLKVERDVKNSGLLPSISDLGLSALELERLRPEIIEFYEKTSLYELDLKIDWSSFFRVFGALLSLLYSNRLKQLNFPIDSREMCNGIDSELVTLTCPATGTVKYRVWYRTLRSTGRVLYSGIYSTCQLPSGKVCIKVCFPLPRGNATVIMEPRVDENGELHLDSSGKTYGDPGFYFLLNDSKGTSWVQYIRSFRESLNVYVDSDGRLAAKHSLTLWKKRVLDIFYKMSRDS